MSTVKQLLDGKGRGVFQVVPDASVFEAVRLMDRHGVGALLVMEGDKLCGVISERDYARKIILRGKASKETLVREIMTRPVIYVSEDETVENCMALMTQKRVRHLPVLTEGRVVGVVSIGDVVKAMLTEKDLLIDQLARYISTG